MKINHAGLDRRHVAAEVQCQPSGSTRSFLAQAPAASCNPRITVRGIRSRRTRAAMASNVSMIGDVERLEPRLSIEQLAEA